MKSQGLQALVKALFNDKQTKSQFLINPEKVFTRFGLSEEEKTAVLESRAKFGLETGSTQLEENISPMGFWS